MASQGHLRSFKVEHFRTIGQPIGHFLSLCIVLALFPKVLKILRPNY